MRFGWTDEEKEKYFIKAEQQIEAAGFTDFLKIDKTSFGVQGQKMKVFLTPFHRAGNTKKWWEAKRNMPNLRENEPPRNQVREERENHLDSRIHGDGDGGV